MTPPVVALDVTPLIGPATGIGMSVRGMQAALEAAGQPLVPYVLGTPRHRAAAPAGARFVPLPARLALAAWTRADRPRVDRFVRGAQALHATNFVVPPTRLPTLATVHDCSFALFPETVNAVAARFGAGLARAVRRGAHLHVTTAAVAAEVEDLFGPDLQAQGRLHVVPFGVPPLGPPAAMSGALRARLGSAPYVLALGTREPRKNHAALVVAFGAVAARHPDIRLVLAGPDGAARPAVDAAVAALPAGLRDRVVILGRVDDPGRRALLDGATLLIYPSLYEGFGFPVLEAMSVGVPVLAADVGALAEVAAEAAELVDPRHPDALAGALDALLGDPARRAALVGRGTERVRAFTWERTAAGLCDVYARLVPDLHSGPVLDAP